MNRIAFCAAFLLRIQQFIDSQRIGFGGYSPAPGKTLRAASKGRPEKFLPSREAGRGLWLGARSKTTLGWQRALGLRGAPCHRPNPTAFRRGSASILVHLNPDKPLLSDSGLILGSWLNAKIGESRFGPRKLRSK